MKLPALPAGRAGRSAHPSGARRRVGVARPIVVGDVVQSARRADGTPERCGAHARRDIDRDRRSRPPRRSRHVRRPEPPPGPFMASATHSPRPARGRTADEQRPAGPTPRRPAAAGQCAAAADVATGERAQLSSRPTAPATATVAEVDHTRRGHLVGIGRARAMRNPPRQVETAAPSLRNQFRIVPDGTHSTVRRNWTAHSRLWHRPGVGGRYAEHVHIGRARPTPTEGATP